METSFHPSLTLVPSLANYSLSLYTPPPPLTGESLIHHTLPFIPLFGGPERTSLSTAVFVLSLVFLMDYILLVLLMTLLYRIVS